MLGGTIFIDCTSMFSPYDFEKIDSIILRYFKNEQSYNTHSNLSDQAKFRSNEINKIKDYLHSEIQERKIMSKKPSKYTAAFDYIHKTLIVLSATSRGISVISFTSVIGVSVGITSASFSLAISITIGIIKKLLIITRNITRNKIKLLCQLKAN